MKIRYFIYYPVLFIELIVKNFIFHLFYGPYLFFFKKYLLNPKLIPVYIISFNRLKYLKQTIHWLESYGHKRIIIIDNNSSYKPLLDFYNETPHKVIRIKTNKGHLVFQKDLRFFFVRNFTFYIMTDPDLLPIKNCPNDYIKVFIDLIKLKTIFTKVGFSLKIDDLPDEYSLKNTVIQWETKFYEQPFIHNNLTLYKNQIDTTFALYRPKIFCPKLNDLLAIRVGYPYQLHHLPWYTIQKDNEDLSYIQTLRTDVSNWNGNFDEDFLKNRYLKKDKIK